MNDIEKLYIGFISLVEELHQHHELNLDSYYNQCHKQQDDYKKMLHDTKNRIEKNKKLKYLISNKIGLA